MGLDPIIHWARDPKCALRASPAGLGNVKCKQHLAFRPKIHPAPGRAKVGNCKFFWHSATLPSYM